MRIDRDFALLLLQGAKGRGADLAEVHLMFSRKLSVEVKEQRVDALESSVDTGYSLRVIKGKRLGFSYARDRADAERVIENALEAARWVGEDAYFDLASPAEHSALSLYDEAIAALTQEEALSRALAIERAALESDPRIRKVRKASAVFSEREVIILNSKGVDKSYSATACSGQIMVVAEDGEGGQTGWDFDGSRFLADVRFDAIGRNAAIRAVQLLGARKIEKAKAHVVLENSVSAEFLGIFASLLSSEAVQKGRSLLSEKMDRKVISPLVSIVDDGGIGRMLGSRPFDDEGVPTSGKHLIKEGVLRGYMYNIHTAGKDGTISTGNGLKSSFASLPSVSHLNLFIEVSPEARVGDLKSAVNRCLYVTDAMGVHTANPVSGEFSIGVSGLWIEGGTVKQPVKEAVISGNILDFFRKVEAAGDDFRFYGNVGSPSLLIGPTDISA